MMFFTIPGGESVKKKFSNPGSSISSCYHNVIAKDPMVRSLLEHTSEMMFVHTLEGKILDVNEAAVEELGYSREELLNLTIFDLDPKAKEKKHQEFIWEKDFSLQKTVSIETIHQRKDDTQYPARVNITKLKLEKHEILLAFAQNISQEKAHQDESQLLTNTLYHIIQVIPSGFFIYQFHSPDQLFLVHANPEAGKHSREDITFFIGREFDEIWPNVQQTALKQNLLQALLDKKTFVSPAFSYEDEYTQGVFQIRAFPLPEDRLAIAFENIGILKNTEEKLNENEQILNAFFEYCPIQLFIKDHKHTIVKVSKSVEDMLDIPVEMLINKRMHELLSLSGKLTEDQIEKMIQTDSLVIKQNTCIESENFINHKIYHSIKFPVHITKERTYIGGFKMDITGQKSMENSLKEQLEELNRFKKLTLERELKMIELKKEINQLLLSQGKEEKYRIIE
jgi:PAS domain S-box-containing protein